MNKRLFAVIGVWAISSLVPAWAFLGIGDVSFDPTNYGELVSIYSELEQSYTTLSNQLQTLQDLKSITTQAQQSYDSIRNKDYYALAGRLAPALKLDAVSATQARIEALLNKDPANRPAYEIELRQLKNIAALMKLQGAASQNLNGASRDLNSRDSGQVTAQSAATLAALAAAEARSHSIKTAGQAQASIDAGNLVHGAGAIYRSLGAQ
ncbi:MAG: hypothetical protein ACYDDO_04740 [Acidiferrobacterales bacterium]